MLLIFKMLMARLRNTSNLAKLTNFNKLDDSKLASLNYKFRDIARYKDNDFLKLFDSEDNHSHKIICERFYFDVLVGKMLGDASIGDIYPVSGTGRINFAQSSTYSDYLRLCRKLVSKISGIEVSDFANYYLDKANSRVEKMSKFKIKSSKLGGLFSRIFYSSFYCDIKEKYYKKKDVNNFFLLWFLINENSITFWHLDDGYHGKKSYMLCTASLKKDTVYCICDVVYMKFGIFCYPRKSSNYERYFKKSSRSKNAGNLDICFPASSYNSFTKLLHATKVEFTSDIMYKFGKIVDDIDVTENSENNIKSAEAIEYLGNRDTRIEEYYNSVLDITTARIFSALAHMVKFIN